MKFKGLLKKNIRLLGVIGIAGSWFTIGTGWAGNPVLPMIGFVLTGAAFTLAILGIKV